MGSIKLMNTLESFSKHLNNMSYFNAAEGSYSSEYEAREACKRKLRKHSKVLRNLYGLTEEELEVCAQGKLVSTSDYLGTSRTS